ncbi:hypothetical protein F5Y17DRAFT_448607 [Xylariaceae sp. FL0594]|nr:hypothetical protein F5Y17DRAFT_448607 [Xylariaceae sp. FL0594]
MTSSDQSEPIEGVSDPVDRHTKDVEQEHTGDDNNNKVDETNEGKEKDDAKKDQSVSSAKNPPSDDEQDEGEVTSSENTPAPDDSATSTGAPPLPNEQPPQEDDGWDFHWDATHQAYFFYNRITGESTWENPRIRSTGQAQEENTATAAPPANERLPAGGYNPAIHGDYDPNAWYAKNNEEPDDAAAPVMDTEAAYAVIGQFNRFTGKWQGADQNTERHSDEAKSRRQMNAYFDVDAAANAHEGRSLKAERSGKKPTKGELKYFKEKRRARKEEKRRAWLRD